MKFGLEKYLNAINRVKRAILVETQKTVVLKVMPVVVDPFQVVSEKNNIRGWA